MVDDYASLSATGIAERIRTKAVSATEVARRAIASAHREGKRLNAVITVCEEKALVQAERVDQALAAGEFLPRLAGVPIILKDNIVYRDYPTTCGSRMLAAFRPPYDATCVERLVQAGAVIIAKANMDEFAMGSSNEYSAFGPVKNPRREDCVPGGSSGGSCASVAAGITPIACGSDTGGSIRQPAAFCGVVGLKPSYGAVSRYGLVAFASSTDQIGPIARTVADCALLFDSIVGYDPRDATSVTYPHPSYVDAAPDAGRRKFRFGLPAEYMEVGIDPEIRAAVQRVADFLADAGHIVQEVSLPHTDAAIAVYYIIADAEAASNLARFDGVRYGHSAGRSLGIGELYATTRGEGFGPEVVRRIMLGTFALSAGYYDAYYQQAQQVRRLISDDYIRAFERVDLLLTPTTPTAAFRLGEKLHDPLAMYLSDILTVPASLAGIPALSLPCGRTSDGRPIGLQIMAPAFGEADLFRAAGEVEMRLGGTNAVY